MTQKKVSKTGQWNLSNQGRETKNDYSLMDVWG